MTTYAGEIPNLTTIQERWAPPYQYAVDNTTRNVSSLTPATFLNYTGQPSVTISVSSTGVLLVQWGFEGHNNASTASSLRMGVAMTGANSVAASIDINAMVSTNGGGAVLPAASKSTMRMHVYTGLSSGPTTVKLQAYISSTPGTNEEATLDNAWLFVSQFY
jgi:hypothetical protein